MLHRVYVHYPIIKVDILICNTAGVFRRLDTVNLPVEPRLFFYKFLLFGIVMTVINAEALHAHIFKSLELTACEFFSTVILEFWQITFLTIHVLQFVAQASPAQLIYDGTTIYKYMLLRQYVTLAECRLEISLH